MTKANEVPLGVKIFEISEDICYKTHYSEESLIESANDLIKEINDSDSDMKPIPLVKTFEEAKEVLQNNFEINVVKADTYSPNPCTLLTDRAIKENTKWVITTAKNRTGYYVIYIKPLYLLKDTYTYQVKIMPFCLSGYSDNGIQYVEQVSVDKHLFNEPKDLIKFLIKSVALYKASISINITKEIETIEF